MRKGMGIWQFFALISCFFAAKILMCTRDIRNFEKLFEYSFCIFVRIIDETFFNYCKLINLCKPSTVCIMKSIIKGRL